MQRIILVPVNDVDRTWPEVAECFERACARDGHNLTPSWLFTMCRNGNAMLFRIGEDTAFVGQFSQDAKGQFFEILALGGKHMDAWFPELLAWQWPRQFGVTRVSWGGRDAFKKVPGVRVRHTVFEVDLADA